MSNTKPVQKCVARYLIYSAVFGLLFWYTFLPLIGAPNLSSIPGDRGDARFNLYLLEHSYKYVSGQESGFWDVGFFYPHQNVLAYSDNFFSAPSWFMFPSE